MMNSNEPTSQTQITNTLQRLRKFAITMDRDFGGEEAAVAESVEIELTK